MFGAGVAGEGRRIIHRVTSLRDNADQMVQRGRAGMAALEECPEADGCFAAVGFCFGGLVARMMVYGSAMHGFTHEHAVPGAMPGVAYHADTDRESFADAQRFLADQGP